MKRPHYYPANDVFGSFPFSSSGVFLTGAVVRIKKVILLEILLPILISTICWGQGANSQQTETTPRQLRRVKKNTAQKIYVHYMPWFETPASLGNGKWGQHWTMANRSPEIITADGRKQIASYYYPLIGPYASADPDVLNYHILLMKYAGIDGVIADWYGTHEIYDYGQIKKNTDSLLLHAQAAGLEFAICYEDVTLVKNRALTGKDIVSAAKEDILYAEQAYFSNKAYITVNGRPLWLCFSANVLEFPWIWEKAFSVLKQKPLLVSLWYKGENGGYMGAAEFAWVNKGHLTSLQNFYQQRKKHGFIATAYPGFRDFYSEGGWGSSLFSIDHKNTLENTLALAKASGLPILQLCTWNDFGEGTMIEPTLEFNFKSLEAIQQYTGVPYSEKELLIIFQWFKHSKTIECNVVYRHLLADAYSCLVNLEAERAAQLLKYIP
jgi:Glycosyl hydrolase family 99